MDFKGFVLDDFQVDAIRSIERNNSVVVSAPTGTGKTLIADYIIDKYINSRKKIIYTSPIKALSNQKFKQFSKSYGEDKVGLMTGDFVINPNAPVIVMTTEIYRNMLVTKDDFVNSISYVIFDEIHYINDLERGTVWEESIIFSPEHIRFLCLSATIPNAEEFAKWIMSIKNHKVDVVRNEKRAVPLKHFVYEKTLGISTIKEAREFTRGNKLFNKKNLSKKERKQLMKIPAAEHLDLMNALITEKFIPTIFFVFSRKDCEKKSQEAALKFDLTTNEEKREIITTFNNALRNYEEIKKLKSVQLLRSSLTKGIGFHHAGLFPMVKEIVEDLFSRGLIKLLYATETFAVGINMPAKSVAFSSLDKYDGVNFRYLTTKEYWQMAGRAGRRGIDNEGWAVSLIDLRYDDLDKIEYITSGDKEPLISRFRLTDNLILNLLISYTYNDIKKVLKKSFYYYLKNKEETEVRVWSRFKNRVRKLKELGYVSKEGKTLTEKGYFASKIYDHEIEITEIFTTEIYLQLSCPELNALIAAILFDRKTEREHFKLYPDNSRYNKILRIVSKNSPLLMKKLNKTNLKRLMRVVIEWSEGNDFIDVVNLTSMREGDLIRLFRQIIDFLSQVDNAAQKWQVTKKVEECIERIRRDVVNIL